MDEKGMSPKGTADRGIWTMCKIYHVPNPHNVVKVQEDDDQGSFRLQLTNTCILIVIIV